MQSSYIDIPSRSIVDLIDHRGGMIITRINVPKWPVNMRGQGHARTLMQQVLHDADRDSVTLYLQISPSDGLNYRQLKAWYQRLGFRYYRPAKVYRRCSHGN